MVTQEYKSRVGQKSDDNTGEGREKREEREKKVDMIPFCFGLFRGIDCEDCPQKKGIKKGEDEDI